MNELILSENGFDQFQVSFEQGKVEIAGYSQILAQLNELSDYLKNITITKDNIKENKKLVARVRKATKEMNDARIDYKKKYMQPFTVYEEQVKTLTELVQEAEETVRQQIRELDEQEREAKQEKLKTIFEKRKRPYKEYAQFYKFEDFLEPRHLNKSVSINQVENDMVEWLKNRDDDVSLLAALSKRGEINFYDALYKYLETFNVTETLDYFMEKDKKQEEMREKIVEVKTETPVGSQSEFINVIFDKKDFERLEPVIIAMGIEYQCC